MNVENIRKMIDVIRDHQNQFSMRQFVRCENVEQFIAPPDEEPAYSDELDMSSSPLHNCGTACCLAGWANALDAANHPKDFINYGDTYNACEYMGISQQNGYPLFYPGTSSAIWNQAKSLGLIAPGNAYGATADEAIAVLEAIIDGRIELLTDL